MDSGQLRSKLTDLHQLLSHSPAVDAESRQLLGTVLQDIEQLLQSPAATEAAPRQVPRLEELATRFEIDHPAMSGALRQLTDLLGKAGI